MSFNLLRHLGTLKKLQVFCCGGKRKIVLWIIFSAFLSVNSYTLCRLVSRCTVAFEKNHRPQELRVPHIEAGGIPGVPSGRCPDEKIWHTKYDSLPLNFIINKYSIRIDGSGDEPGFNKKLLITIQDARLFKHTAVSVWADIIVKQMRECPVSENTLLKK